MAKVNKQVSALIFVILLAVCWGGSLTFKQKLADMSGSVSVRYTDGGVSPAQVSRALRYGREDGNDAFPELTLWREKQNQSISDGNFRLGTADIYEIFGNGSQLMPLSLTSGSLPAKGDTQGCAVSRDVAQNLWGSGDVLGKTLIYEDVSYTVRGVFTGCKNLVMIQGGADEEDLYPALLLTFLKDGGNVTEDTRNFLNRYSLPIGEILDVSLLLWAVSFCTSLPALFLIFWMIFRLVRQCYGLRYAPLICTLFLFLAAGAAFLAVWAGNLMGLPQDLIPTQWSDFDYWSGLIRNIKDSLHAALRLPLTDRDLQIWSAALMGMLLSATAAALSVPAVRRLKTKGFNRLSLCCGIWFATAFTVSLISAAIGGISQNRGFWLTVPAVLVGFYAVECFKQYLFKKEGLDDVRPVIKDTEQNEGEIPATK